MVRRERFHDAHACPAITCVRAVSWNWGGAVKRMESCWSGCCPPEGRRECVKRTKILYWWYKSMRRHKSMRRSTGSYFPKVPSHQLAPGLPITPPAIYRRRPLKTHTPSACALCYVYRYRLGLSGERVPQPRGTPVFAYREKRIDGMGRHTPCRGHGWQEAVV